MRFAPADPNFERRGNYAFTPMPADASVWTVEYKIGLPTPPRRDRPVAATQQTPIAMHGASHEPHF